MVEQVGVSPTREFHILRPPRVATSAYTKNESRVLYIPSKRPLAVGTNQKTIEKSGVPETPKDSKDPKRSQ
jgi:hypothetical protein